MADTTALVINSTFGKLDATRYKLGFYREHPRSHLMWLVCMDCNKAIYERADDSGALSLSVLLETAGRHESTEHAPKL